MTLERRRVHTMVGATVVFVGLVLLTSFPLSAVLSQRSALSGSAHDLATVRAQNRALARQVSDLANPAAINGLARHNYGFVPVGRRAYDILPASSSSGSAVPGSGQVPLSGPPVVPGSARSQALTGIVASAGGASASGLTGGGRSGGAGSGQSDEPRSYWARVVRSLEFWS
jgi:cell division protein FtsB